MLRSIGHGLRGLCELCALALACANLPAATANTGRYLIVAASGYVNTAPLDQFVAAKTAAGYDVTTYSVSAGTLRAAIKTQIQSWYVAGQPSYVLLIGDTCGTTAASTATNLPHWTGGGTMHAPTDLPYACMGAGDDWFPDVYLGRLPIDTVAELQAYVNKVLFVEAGNFSDPDYTKRVALLATGDSSAQADQTHDAAIANYLAPAGFTSTRIYASQGGGTTQVVSAINNGTLLMIYMGHSSQGAWWEPSFQVSNVPSLNNAGKYGLMLSFSCSTAGFDWWYAECLGEVLLREANRGSVAFIGTTMLLPAGEGMWIPSQRMESHFLTALLVQNAWQVGPLMQAMLYGLYTDPDYGPSDPDTRDYYELFALLGDPTLVLPHETPADGDYNTDGDVDLLDLAEFQTCFTGPGGGPIGAHCGVFDFEPDDDVDAADFVEMTQRAEGPRH